MLVVIYVPLALVLINSFNVDRTFGWPPRGFTLHWWQVAAHRRRARATPSAPASQVALLATAVALVLGTLAGVRAARYRLLRPQTVSLLIILPIALPGIVTGIALNNAFRTMLGIELGFLTDRRSRTRRSASSSVFNNVQARLRRSSAAIARGGVDGPRRRAVHDLPAGDVPAAALGAARRRRCSRSR